MPTAQTVGDLVAHQRKVTINLSDVDRSEDYPDRIIVLQHPTWSAMIGRGSTTDESILPSPSNSFFTSKVVSRNHAEISANPEDKVLTIRDLGSMHGTWLDGKKVGSEAQQLIQEDIITFGSKVQRGSESFEPLKTILSYDWSDNGTDGRRSARNTFTSDFGDYDDDDSLISDVDDTGSYWHSSKNHPRDLRDRSPSLEIVSSPAKVSPGSAVSIDLTQDDSVTSVSGSDALEASPSKTNSATFEPHLQSIQRNETVNAQPQTANIFADDNEFDDDEGIEEALISLSGQTYQPESFTGSPVATQFQPCASSHFARLVERDPSPSDAALAKSTPPWRSSSQKSTIENTSQHLTVAASFPPPPTFASESFVAETPHSSPLPKSVQAGTKRTYDEAVAESDFADDSADCLVEEVTTLTTIDRKTVAETVRTSQQLSPGPGSQAKQQYTNEAQNTTTMINTTAPLGQTHSQVERGPARKKARFAANAAKNAGLVLTGVAAGVVGTVVTLASLPTDFFA